ncbi:3,4-dihydroxy-2-butanone-4-phosphate synthase [Rhodococcus sp. OK302]|uniref:3,4-dihydroxy-2-butanone-4-phosphate synthase n=1 Tax=Rhodococcus sp. OK302 TaxID=1882769 RepID=UPI000B93FCC4|nr:3,4-dihydroxy-2-butanone-4-phosphate synthase [Rhodococcus sp. OK302]OYD70385.1 3,4-dihydroxy 2-butanone 4-phosphate synthase/GTP cyclohydrolase II [Rhodococcus sp. OK302]
MSLTPALPRSHAWQGRSAIQSAVSALQAGRPVLLRAESGSGGGYDVVLPAALADTAWTAWAVRWSSGFLYAPLPADLAEALDLPLMVRGGDNPATRTHTVSIDAAVGITTGISALDRARTARVLADPGSTPADFTRPGHLMPVVASNGGVTVNPGRVEAAVDLCRLAGLPPVALTGQLVRDDGELVRELDMADLGDSHDHPIVDVADLVTHRLFVGDGIRGRVTRALGLPWHAVRSALEVVGFVDAVTGAEHIVLRGPGTPSRPVVSVHAECTMGDIFGSDSCFCGRELAEATERIAVDGGLLVYLRRPHGRGAPVPTGHAWTEADDGALAAILHSLGATSISLFDGPASRDRLSRAGVTSLDVARGAAENEPEF